MSDLNLYHHDTGMLSLVDDKMKAEFKVATRQAIENMEDEFTFYGCTVGTADAVDVVQAIEASRTYH